MMPTRSDHQPIRIPPTPNPAKSIAYAKETPPRVVSSSAATGLRATTME